MTPPRIRWRVTAIDPGREKLPWCIPLGHAACVEDLARSCWCPRKLASPRFECGRDRRCCRYSTFLRRRAMRCIPPATCFWIWLLKVPRMLFSLLVAKETGTPQPQACLPPLNNQQRQ
ncbi:unnamed protein product [Ectocarpus sp. 12 AP-2014]